MPLVFWCVVVTCVFVLMAYIVVVLQSLAQESIETATEVEGFLEHYITKTKEVSKEISEITHEIKKLHEEIQMQRETSFRSSKQLNDKLTSQQMTIAKWDSIIGSVSKDLHTLNTDQLHIFSLIRKYHPVEPNEEKNKVDYKKIAQQIEKEKQERPINDYPFSVLSPTAPLNIRKSLDENQS